jgi:ATP-dependent RNA helicase DeaD
MADEQTGATPAGGDAPKKTAKRTGKKKTSASGSKKKAIGKKSSSKKTASKAATKKKTAKAGKKKTAKKAASEKTTKKTAKTRAGGAAKKATRKTTKKKTKPVVRVEASREEAVEPPAELEERRGVEAGTMGGDQGVEPATGERDGGAQEAGETPKRDAKKRSRRGGRKKEHDGGGGRDTGGDAATGVVLDAEDEAAATAPAGPDARAPIGDIESRVENWEEVFEEQTFRDLKLRESVCRGTDAMGFKHPTKIQAELVPLVLRGRDVLGQSRTGTGKTAAFGLPLLHLADRGKAFQTIVLAPTRELAIQIADEMRDLARFTPVRVSAVYGGQKIQSQAKRLEKKPEIIVATPGRLLDMKERGYLHFRNVRYAVLDEVDRMLDIGFRDDIKRILSQMPRERQTVFVSATIGPEIEQLARTFMDNPEKLVTTGSSLTVSLVKQFYISVARWDKPRMLRHIFEKANPELTIVFCRMKRTVDKVAKYLTDKGIDAHAIHGDMYQGKRNSVIRKLREGEMSVVVASDLAARGLDVEGITHVINFDLPEDPEVYIHRIGRTARAGREGVAWSFVTPEEGGLLTDIEMLANTHIEPLEYRDFKPGPVPKAVEEEKQRDAERHKRLEGQSRFAERLPGQTATKDAKRFPGGVVPTKLPPKRLRGKIMTARSAKRAPSEEGSKSED